MTQYCNPPSKVAEVGRRLTGWRDYRTLRAQLHAGEHMVVVGDRLVYKVAPYIESAADFDDFYAQYYGGGFVSLDVYAVPASVLPDLGVAVTP